MLKNLVNSFKAILKKKPDTLGKPKTIAKAKRRKMGAGDIAMARESKFSMSPADHYSHGSKTFKKNKRKGL